MLCISAKKGKWNGPFAPGLASVARPASASSFSTARLDMILTSGTPLASHSLPLTSTTRIYRHRISSSQDSPANGSFFMGQFIRASIFPHSLTHNSYSGHVRGWNKVCIGQTEISCHGVHSVPMLWNLLEKTKTNPTLTYNQRNRRRTH